MLRSLVGSEMCIRDRYSNASQIQSFNNSNSGGMITLQSSISNTTTIPNHPLANVFINAPMNNMNGLNDNSSLNPALQLQQAHAPLNISPNQQQNPQMVAGTGGQYKLKQTQQWHLTTLDLDDIRQSVRTAIISLLSSKRPNPTPEMIQAMPRSAQKLEEALFSRAQSVEEFKDMNTLKERLSKLAAEMNRNKQMNSQQMSQQQQQQKQYYQQQNQNNLDSGPYNNVMNNGNQMKTSPPQGDGRQFVQVSEINPLMASSNNPSGPTSSAAGISTGSDADYRKQVLRQQQQRLLLLRHASKCPHEKCPVTTHCESMKILWRHIMTCKEVECKVAHCVSSRYVLSHYSKCRESTCPVCGPVREAIKRNSERGRAIVQMSQHSGMIMPGEHKKSNEPSKPKVIKPLDPISCSMYSFTDEEVSAHYKSIHEGMKNNSTRIKEICFPPLDEMLKMPEVYGIFGYPVDPVALGLPDYFDIVKNPIDLGTIKKKLDQGVYRDSNAFVDDVNLCFDNAILYNPVGSLVHNFAQKLKKQFAKLYKVSIARNEDRLTYLRNNPENCLICGEFCLKFEPPVYYCNGSRCGGQRIRRNAFYYTGGNNAYHWCHSCFNELPDDQPIRLIDCTLYKHDVKTSKKKHDDEDEEVWVQCSNDDCRRWAHILCALFNRRRNVNDDFEYLCPPCLTERRKKAEEGMQIMLPLNDKKTSAKDLPHNVLSQFIEARIYERLELTYQEQAEKLGIPVENVEKCSPFYLRQVSSFEKMQPTKEGVLDRYQFKNYPKEFPVKIKCLTLFQCIDGQDVLLFGMYVYEYGHKCPLPNQRKVYISYLDSVHYLRPRQYRTLVYHEIIIAYLEYVKKRGFHTCHIWACPPLKGDDYIFHIHPPDQKTPKDDKLRKWYQDLLITCQSRGIVTEITDLYTEFLANPANDATVLPYLEGEYWVNEAEVIIKSLKQDASTNSAEPEGHDDTDVLGQKSKRKKQRSVTRAVRSSDPLSQWPNNNERDPVMAKLASIIEPMKEAFFVARLHSKEYAAQKWQQRLQELEAEEEAKKQTPINEEKEEDVAVPVTSEIAQNNTTTNENKSIEMEMANNDSNEGTTISSNATKGVNTTPVGSDEGNTDVADNDSISPKVEETDTSVTAATSPKGRRGKKGAAGTQDKKDIDAINESKTDEIKDDSNDKDSNNNNNSNTDNEKTDTSASATVEVKMEIDTVKDTIVTKIDANALLAGIMDDTEDADDTQDSAFFDTRQTFLNLCQGNHYQFDQLRRVKHTSMMILYHVHNPDAPKFIRNCYNCRNPIIGGGPSYCCSSCDIHFCYTCLKQYGSKIHNHQLRLGNTNILIY